jgi:hypothetical protein
MPATFNCIATTTLGSAASGVTFSSIPGTFTDLVIIGSAQHTSSQIDLNMRFNGDSSSVYNNVRLYGNATSIDSDKYSDRDTILSVGYIGTTAFASSVFASFTVNIFSYTNTNIFKTILGKWGSRGTSNVYSMCNMGQWRSTSAITSVLVQPDTGNFASGTTISLYGIKAA